MKKTVATMVTGDTRHHCCNSFEFIEEPKQISKIVNTKIAEHVKNVVMKWRSGKQTRKN